MGFIILLYNWNLRKDNIAWFLHKPVNLLPQMPGFECVGIMRAGGGSAVHGRGREDGSAEGR